MNSFGLFAAAVIWLSASDASRQSASDACDSFAHAACVTAFNLTTINAAICGSGPTSFLEYDRCTNSTECMFAISPALREAVAAMCSAPSPPCDVMTAMRMINDEGPNGDKFAAISSLVRAPL